MGAIRAMDLGPRRDCLAYYTDSKHGDRTMVNIHGARGRADEEEREEWRMSEYVKYISFFRSGG